MTISTYMCEEKASYNEVDDKTGINRTWKRSVFFFI